MFHATLRTAFEDARSLAGMDELSRTIWQAYGSGTIGDDEAQTLAEALHGSRIAIRGALKPVGIPIGPAMCSPFPPKQLQRAGNRTESLSRRRHLAESGPVPPRLAARFTTGQLAVLRIVGDEIAEKGVCGLCIDAIAARAGVCRRLAQIDSQIIGTALARGVLRRSQAVNQYPDRKGPRHAIRATPPTRPLHL